MDKHLGNIRERAEAVLNRSDIDISRLPADDIQKLIVEFESHLAELELRNEELSRAYQDLNETRERYGRLYNSGTVGYLTLTEDGVILDANCASAKILHYPQEMLANKSLQDFIQSEDVDAYLLFMHSFATQDSGQTLIVRLNVYRSSDNSLQCPGLRLMDCTQQSCSQNNSFIYVEFRHAVNFYNNSDHRLYWTITDISERIQAQERIACLNEKLEEKIAKQTQDLVESNLSLQKKIEEVSYSKRQLLEREAKLNAIFNAAIEGIITTDKVGLIVSANSAVETIFGYNPEELVGCTIAKLLPSEKRKAHGFLIQTQSRKAIDRVRTVDGLRKDGSLVPLDISVAEFFIEGTGYYTSIVRDVSLRKLKEQEDKEHVDALAHVTRLGLMGEMASGIAHEVNQPLTAITGYAQACLNLIEFEQPDLPKLKDVLQKIHQQALKAGQIIHRMREFVTFKTVHQSTVEINGLINACVELCLADLKQNHILPTLDLAKNLPFVYVDSVQIEQVVLNLIRNSLDSLKNLPEYGQRLLSIQTRKGDHNCIVVRVKDNGPGINETEQQKILTPFYTTKKSGMGMGLSISQSIVKAHGGMLFFNSKPGKGATFYFTLPA